MFLGEEQKNEDYFNISRHLHKTLNIEIDVDSFDLDLSH